MVQEKKLKHNLRVVFVQPIQAPYWTERLESLAQQDDLDLYLLLETEGLPNRPGWSKTQIEGVSVEVVSSWVIPIRKRYCDMEYTICGFRIVPWGLPFRVWKIRPDVVVTCNATELLLLYPLRRLLGFILVHNVEDSLYSIRNKNLLSKALKAFFYRKANRLFAYSQNAAEYLDSIGAKEKVTRTSWSVDLQKFQPNTREVMRFRGKYGAEGKMLFLFAGALEKAKGVDVLLRAWDMLSKEVIGRSALVVAGQGSLFTELSDFVVKKNLNSVYMLGHVPFEQLRHIYAASDVLILPTLQDLFSLVVLEAMASECLVITTKFNGASELVEEGETGWILNELDEARIVEVITLASKSEGEIPAMKKKARERVAMLNNDTVMQEFSRAIYLEIRKSKERQ